MHSHHSHSGQYVQHAVDTLEEVVLKAIEKGFKLYCLTEHMPRLHEAHLYAEEVASHTTVAQLAETYDAFYKEAVELKKKYADKISLLVGIETEAITDEYFDYFDQLRTKYVFDLVVGSVHHVHEIPIDMGIETINQAIKISGSVENLHKDYYDLQFEMMKRVRPTVVAHFDLISLFAPLPGEIPAAVRERIERNAEYAALNGFLVEVNSAAVRKGWPTPYPAPPILEIILSKKGKLCLSDDSHGTAQVGLNYHVSANYLKNYGVGEVYSADGRCTGLPQLDVFLAQEGENAS